MSKHHFLEEIRFTNAESLLDYLRPCRSHWGDGTVIPWIFRGHANEKWDLLPKLWRQDGRQFLEPLLRSHAERRSDRGGWNAYQRFVSDTQSLAANRELSGFVMNVARDASAEAVFRFLKLADELGLAMPEPFDAARGRSALDHRTPCANTALAQHHGIPTSLLDWTINPMVAAYFASQTTSDREADALAVWAYKLSPAEANGEIRTRSLIQTKTFARSSAQYLHAQSGVFTWHGDIECDNFFFEHGRYPTLVDMLNASRGDPVGVCVRKLVLGRTHADVLTSLLLRERVTKAHLMPTLDNVAETSRQMWSPGNYHTA